MSEAEEAAASASTNTTPEQEENALEAEGLQSGAEVSASPSEETSDETGLAIGDWVNILWGQGSQKTVGTIYYIDADLLRVMPESASSILVDFPLRDGGFAEEVGFVEDEFEYEEGKRTPFVELNGLAVGQKVDAYDKLGAHVATFEVVALNPEDDKARLRNIEDGDERDYSFNHRGIDLSEPFAILRVQPQSQPDAPLSQEELNYQNAAETLQQIDGADDPLLAALAAGDTDIEVEEIGNWKTEQFERAETISAKERVYSEFDQKDDMRSDLIGMLDAPSQQNPLLRKRIRALVEMMAALKQTTIQYKYDGTYEGPANVSLDRLADVLKDRDVPIARPVLETKRVLVTEKSGSNDTIDGIVVKTLDNLTEDSKEYLERLNTLPIPEEGVGLPRFYQAFQTYFSQFPLGDTYGSTGYRFQKDGEYFRRQPPGTDGIPGLPSGSDQDGELRDDRYEGENPEDYVRNIDQSLRRAHGPTTIALPKGGTDVLKSGDVAPVNGYVLFPYNAVETGVVGSSRTGVLLEDILRSFTYEKSWMSELLKELGGIESEEPDAKKVLYFKVDGTLYEITFADYLKLVLRSIIPFGPGDLFPMKKDLGIEEAEPTVEQSEIIQERVKEVIAGLIKTVTELRKELEAKVVEPVANPILEDGVGKRMADAVFAFPFLADILKKMDQRTPGYKDVDVAVMGSLMVYAQDFAIAVLAGNTVAKQRELLKANMNRFLQTIADAKAYQILQQTRGAPPEINPCSHVQALNQIRRLDDDATRMRGMVKLLKLYRGGREDNWVLCGFCNKHLICQHEVLQLQQFLNPAQHLVLQKEIVLNYAGGTFGANHICKNCGLKIAELGFDTSLEYDDDGRPMMGRSVLVDEDAKAIEAISDLFDLPAEEQDEIRFDTTTKNECYDVLKQLLLRFGIEMDMKTQRRLVEQGDSRMSALVDEKVYEGVRTKGDKKPPYSVYRAFAQVAIMGALFLVEIQTRRPGYMPKLWLEGCKPGFGGYPLQPDSSPDNAEQAVGLEYILCGTLGIQKTTYPWSEVARVRKADERKALLKYHLKEQVSALVQNAEVQAELNKKREYLRDIFGGTSASGKHSEVIPKGFLPHVETEFEGTKAAAREPTVSEGAYGMYGETVLADAWIRAVNRLAKETTPYIENTPFIETGCCFSPISRPGLYFQEAVLPPLPKKRPLAPGFYRQSILYTPMIPRPLVMFDAKPDMKVAFRVFLKVCWRGERKGLTHEIGYDNKCDWCGIEIPSAFLYPDVNKDGEPILDEEKLRVELDRQGIPLNEEGFQDLLDTTNRRQIFKSYKKRKPLSGAQILETLANAEPAPVFPLEEQSQDERWQGAIAEMFENINRLPENASEAEIKVALQPLSEATEDAMEALLPVLAEQIQGRQPIPIGKLLFAILNEAPSTVLDILRTYFVVPAERIRQDYSVDTLQVPKHYKLMPEHVKQLDDLLKNHTSYLAEFNTFKQKGMRKLRYFADTLAASLDAAQELHVSRMSLPKLNQVGKTLLVKQLLKTIMVGCLGQLADASFDPPAEEGEEEIEGGDGIEDETSGDDDALLKRFIVEMIKKYYKERTVYNPAQVREELAKAKELEKNTFIGILDKIDNPEERRTELMFKRLKMKTSRHNWNLGATALSYDDVWLENQAVLGKMYDVAAELGQGVPGEIPEGFGMDELGWGGDDGMGPTEDGYDMVAGTDRDDEL